MENCCSCPSTVTLGGKDTTLTRIHHYRAFPLDEAQSEQGERTVNKRASGTIFMFTDLICYDRHDEYAIIRFIMKKMV